MDKTITEIRLYGPGIGYGAEMIHDANPQAAINIVKARIPNAQILGVKYHTVKDGSNGRSDSSDRRR